MAKNHKIVEAPKRSGYIIECEDKTEWASTLYHVNQIMSQHNLNKQECIARDEENGEIVAKIHMVNGNLKWEVFRHIPSFSDMLKQLDNLRRQMDKIGASEKEVGTALKKLKKAKGLLDNISPKRPTQMKQYLKIEERERRKMSGEKEGS